ncbi:hypothetical protein BZA77DRAFT_254642 [Pyronema omphalodes]|nr:hypothetical protein BZA77DRAFT_254642 [Pyronema omphalodes]
MVPFPKNEKYVGQSQVRMFVEQKRRTQDSVISHVSVALHGLGGVGKTQDVLHFVYSCRKAHSVFWIYCESATRFDEDYRKLAKLVKIPGYNESDSSQDFREIVKRWLEAKESGDWILVLDNADNKTDFFPGRTGDNSPGLARYIPKCAKGTIIITTRDYEVARQLASSGDVLTKEEMSFDDAIALFQRNYPCGAPYENTDCDKLLHELQYLPLAITQVASYLEMNREIITPTQYLAKFRKTKTDQQQLLSKPVYNSFRQDSSVSSAGNAETVLTTFAITFQQIQKQSPLASSILRLIACIGAQEIPHELLAELESQSDEIILGEALAKLRNFSLLQRQKDSAGTTYTLHSLVHLAVQYFLSPEEKVSAMETTARALSHVIPSNEAFENWPRWRLYLPHTTAFLSYCGQEIENINVAAICFSMAEYLLETGRYRESQPLAERSVTIRNRLLGHDHSETLKSMLLQAEVLFQIGMHHECEKLEVEVVALSKQALGEDHPQTLKAKSSLALTLRRRGRLNEAGNIQRNILECRKVILGEDHPETLIAMNNLASTLQENARLDEAEILQRKVLEIQLLVLGEQHPGTISAMNNVTITLQYKGRLDEAEILQRKALETSIVILGEDHPDTLGAISNLAITLWNRGNLDEAETLQRNVLKTYKVLLGDDHPNTLTVMNNLSLTIQDKGEWGEAEILQKKVVELRKVAFGEDHPDTLTAISNLALTLRHNGNLDEAERLQQNVLETRKIVFGEDHPETLIAFGNLALTLWNKGRSDEAETLQRKVLETYKVVLGKNHPDTLGAMSNLALSLQDNGRWNEAETLQETVVEIRKDLLGEDHPDTLKIMHQLAYTYHAKSFVDVAIEMMEEVVSRRSRILGNEDEDTKSSMAFLNKWKSEKED